MTWPHPKLVLLIDEDPLRRRKVEMDFLGHGFCFAGVGSIGEAIERASNEDVALVLMEGIFPYHDGMHPIRVLRQHAAFAFVPIMLMVVAEQAMCDSVVECRADPTHLLRGFSEGALDYIAYPYDAAALLDKVHVLVHAQELLGQPPVGAAVASSSGPGAEGASGALPAAPEPALLGENETCLRRYVRLLHESRERLLAISENRSAMLAQVSHELRTPLSVVIGYSEMVQEELQACGQEDIAADVSRIQLAADHLLSIVNGILDLSRIDRGHMWLNLEEFEVSRLVRRVAESVERLAEERGNTLTVRLAPGCGVMRSDAGKLRQMLYNLLSNACKFTAGGSILLEARRVHRSNSVEQMVFQVTDTGSGMAPEELPLLFHEFSQLPSSQGTASGSFEPSRDSSLAGAGLGLAITDRFCRLLGGSIQVESTPGIGSTFTVSLPAYLSDTVLPTSRPDSRR